jgi:hypothetical protein
MVLPDGEPIPIRLTKKAFSKALACARLVRSAGAVCVANIAGIGGGRALAADIVDLVAAAIACCVAEIGLGLVLCVDAIGNLLCLVLLVSGETGQVCRWVRACALLV